MIRELLPVGLENAVSGRYLCDLLDIDPRTLRTHVEAERRAEAPICASTEHGRSGYFVARNKGEMEAYCSDLRQREDSIRETREACEKTIDTLPDGREVTC